MMILKKQIIRFTGPNIPDTNHAHSPTSESRRRHRLIIIIIIYKYLGIEESFDIQHKNEKEKLKKEYLEIEASFGYRIMCKE